MAIMSLETVVVGDTGSSVLDHEEQDFERVVQTWSARSFGDWPNEAGVCHFIQMTT